MQFFLLILSTFMLFLRPAELIPDLQDDRFYRIFIFLCLLASLPAVATDLLTRFRHVPPIKMCVLGLVPIIAISNLVHSGTDDAVDAFLEYVKVVIYYMLVLVLVPNVARLRQFLTWVIVFTAMLGGIALFRYHADLQGSEVKNQTVKLSRTHHRNGTYVVEKRQDSATGEEILVTRMCGTGIFNDPNDLALAMVAAIPFALYRLTDPTEKKFRYLWAGAIFIFGYALLMTHSRGGLIAMIAGLGVFYYCRYGLKKTMILMGCSLPVLLLVFAGRMTEISTNTNTGQARIQLWFDGMQMFRENILLGVGMDNFTDHAPQVAHHSFIQCYSELGILGGSLFLGAFFYSLTGMYHLTRSPLFGSTQTVQKSANIPQRTGIVSAPTAGRFGVSINPLHPRSAIFSLDAVDPELKRLLPYMFASLVSYTVGICFLSRSYIVPTFMMLGIMTVFLRLCAAQPPQPLLNFNRHAALRLAGASFAFLVGTFLFVRTFVNW